MNSMALPAIWMSIRRQKSPSTDAFVLPVLLDDSVIIQKLIFLANELLAFSSKKKLPFHHKKTQSLIRTVGIFRILFEYLRDLDSHVLPPTAYLCFKEVYLLFHESKILLDYCFGSSRLWLLIQNGKISRHFDDISREILMVLDVLLPLEELELCEDVSEHLELLKKQLTRNKFPLDEEIESIRTQLLRFLEEFKDGKIPDSDEIQEHLVKRIEIRNAKRCRKEIRFLEKLMRKNDDDYEPPSSVLRGIIAFVRYSRFLFFGSEPDTEESLDYCYGIEHLKTLIWQETLMNSIEEPTEFICPISYDVMQYPVVISTGHTFDRDSISKWMKQNNFTCPKTRQKLASNLLIPNKALQRIISQWCLAYEVPCPPPEPNPYSKTSASFSCTRTQIEANRATSALLIKLLSRQSADGVRTVAAKELCSIVKTGVENWAYIVECGAIPRLQKLLSSLDRFAQESAITILMCLSIENTTKSLIMDQEGCLRMIIGVIMFGHSDGARENAAFTLFLLCEINEHKRIIGAKDGAIYALIRLLREGNEKGRMIAVKALHRLSSHEDNCIKLVEAKAIKALGEALKTEKLVDEAAGTLRGIAQKLIGAEAIKSDRFTMSLVVGFIRRGSLIEKRNAFSLLRLLFPRSNNSGPRRLSSIYSR